MEIKSRRNRHYDKIINKLLEKHIKYKKKEKMKKIFIALLMNTTHEVQVLNKRVIDNTKFKQNSRRLVLEKKFFSSWLVFTKDSLMRKALKQAEDYRQQLEESQRANAQIKVSMLELQSENRKMSEQIGEIKECAELKQMINQIFQPEQNAQS